jgi:hypothetical protein
MIRILTLPIVVLACIAFGWGNAPQALTAAQIAATSVTPEPSAKLTRTTESAESGPCTLGIISLAGNQFEIERRGLFAFDTEYRRATVENWTLDDLVIARVRAAAPGGGVRRIVYAREELKRAKSSVTWFQSLNSQLSNFVRNVTAGANCKHYVLIHRRGDPFVHGIGIIDFGGPLHRTFLFALTDVRVYDGRTFEMLKHGPALTEDESLAGRAGRPIQGPYRELDKGLFPTAPKDVVNNIALRDGARALLAASLDRALPALLGP